MTVPARIVPELLRRLRERGYEPRASGLGVYVATCPCCGVRDALTIIVSDPDGAAA